jgi:hypothetical protein
MQQGADMRNWNDLVGERINGLYMGLFPYTGTVVESRVKYGGAVQHTVVVDEPFMVYGDLRERILVENGTGEINRILDERDASIDDTWYDEQYEGE